MKKLATAMTALIMFFAATAFAAQPDKTTKPKYKWRFSHYAPVGSLIDKVSRAAVDEIVKKSNGRIAIDYYPANQLGDWAEVSEQIMRGVVQIGLMPVSYSYDPRLQLRVVPFTVATWKEATDAYLGEDPFLFNTMEKLMAGTDLKALGVCAEGMGGGGFAKMPTMNVLDPATDKKGLKMRIAPGNQAWEAFVKSMKFNPIAVPWGDLYMALQTKLIDAQIGGQPYSTWSLFKEVTSCWVQYNTHFQNSFFYMNLKLWNSLSKEDQEIVKNACMAQSRESFVLAKAEDEHYMKLMSEANIKVIVPTEEQLKVIATVAREQVWPVMDPIIGKSIMNDLRQRVGIQTK